jgi:Flp pilus assembly CpaF family ATPase
VDLFTDPGPVRLLVRDVVADYSERSVNSALPPIGDAESVVRDVLDRVAGFGPLQRYLDDPEIEEIWVNEPGRVFIAPRVRPADRHEHAVRRRHDARRLAPARGHPRVHADSRHVSTDARQASGAGDSGRSSNSSRCVVSSVHSVAAARLRRDAHRAHFGA